MIIAINTRLLIKGRIEGIGRFSCEILKRVTKQHPEHTFLFLFDRKYDPQFIFSDNVRPVKLWPPSRHPILWYLFFEWSVKYALVKYKVDLFITMDGWMPLSTNVKVLQVLHDLHYEFHPEFLPYLTRKYYQYFFPKFIKRANRIVTVSHASKSEICKMNNIPEELVDVVYNSSECFTRTLPESGKSYFMEKYSGSKKYFLVLGSIHARKNTDGMIQAFRRFRNLTGQDFKLVITGRTMWRDSVRKAYQSVPDEEIIFTGYVNDKELQHIINDAFALLYCSFYEGFGIPILEAMSCGVPVITSNSSSMPEVAGDAALLTDPHSVDNIAAAMTNLSTNAILYDQLVDKGKANLKRFSWKRSSLFFWESVLKTTSTH